MADPIQQPTDRQHAEREAAKWAERAERYRGTPVAASMRATAEKWAKIAKEART